MVMSDLGQRKTWYSHVANAYNRVRPRYPQELIDRVVELAQLPVDAAILEVGCGPGTATTSFARLGLFMTCLEPSPEACQLARRNCTQYPNVEIVNTTFEEWDLGTQKFHAVLAATSFHWVSPEIGYPKVVEALRDNGSLILLWNMTLQPTYEVYQALNEVYQAQAPSLARYEDREAQAEQLKKLEQVVIETALFKDLISEHFPCEAIYSIDDYLVLLSTYSPYIALDPQQRDDLFISLREVLERNCKNTIQVSYLSAFHIAKK